MHRLLPCLPFLVVALLACDDDDAPAIDSSPEPVGCGMTLPGVGAWTVAQYDDGYIVDANREIALRTTADGMRWHRLDGSGSGPVTLGAAFAQRQTVDLYDRDHVLVRGLTANSKPRARLIRLSSNRIEHEIEYRFEGRGEWVITGNMWRDGVPNPRLLSLRSGKSFELPCELCSIVSVDGFGRAWIGDEYDDTLIEVDLSTGRAQAHPELFSYRASAAGSGLSVWLDQGRGRVLFGAAPGPIRSCADHSAWITPTGQIACLREQALDILDRDGAVVRSVPGVDFRSARPFGTGFLAQTSGRSFAWVPFEGPAVWFQGFSIARTSGVVMFRDFESDETVVLHADGRLLALDYPVFEVPEISADSRFALIRRETDFAVIDLDSGAVTLEVSLERGWKRFVGSALLVEGAPLGETPSPNLSNVAFPDRRCPVMLYEQCDGADCVLNIEQFEEPAMPDLVMNQDG
ncbi:MAG: hypothetical protein ACI9U2_002565 [Bradymonadia bacterium]|jgi:hypothetical protein